MDIPNAVIDALIDVELSLLTLPGVNGVGVGMRETDGDVFDELAIRVLVDDISQVDAGVPSEIAGVEVCVVERRYEPLAAPDLKRYDDLHGGIHIINPGLSEHGTLGAIVQDTSAIASGQLLGLSCFHVVGDRGASFPFTVWQPDSPPIPPASSDDNIGRVQRASFPNDPITTGIGQVRVGLFDAAVFSLDEAFQQPDQSRRTASRPIMGQDAQQPNLADAITDTARAVRTDMEVSKRGAMTRVTHGRVVAPRMSTAWTFLGSKRYILGSIELRVESALTPDRVFCRRGDSGSVVLQRGEPTAVGLLWGGDPSGGWGMMTDIKLIEAALEISMVWS